MTAPGAALAGKHPHPRDAHGPIGLDVYRQLERLPFVPRGVHASEFSSYDRSGGNDDGFEGTYSCLRTTASGCVIAESSGAGEIDSIWFTRDGGDVSATGNLRIELDGNVILDAPLQQVVNGGLGRPFTFPLVANADQSSGGVYIKVPMPFRRSMVVTTDQNPRFYHVNYRTFDDRTGVSTFDPADHADDVLAKLRAAGSSDPKQRARRSKTRRAALELAPGKTATLAKLRGPGAISAIELGLPQLVGPQPTPEITDDGRAFGNGGSSQFTVQIDPANNGVRLTRRLDSVIGNQRAQILVDGVPAGEWAALPASGGGQWLDQSVELPASLTAGKSQITIRNQFISSNFDFNEFAYWADSRAGGGLARSDAIDVGPNSAASEAAHAYSIQNQTWSGVRTYRYPPGGDPAAIGASSDILRGARLVIKFDGRRMVDAPIGQFFGAALGESAVASLMFSVDPSSGRYASWWPMPYRSRAKVQIVNGSSHAIRGLTSTVRFARSDSWERKLSRGGNAGYFHTASAGGSTLPGIDWTLLRATGRGKLVGVVQAMDGPDRGYLEGDEIGFVDGSRVPALHGTGTEDFYEGGWYFNRGPFSNPFNGEPSFQSGGVGCTGACDGVYRLLIADAIPFSSSIDLGIEHGSENSVQAVYSSTAFWYGRR